MVGAILKTPVAAMLAALLAGPAAAQWTFNAYEGGAIASVAESDGREFGIECTEDASDVMRLFVILRPRGAIREGRTPFKFSIGRQEYSIEADLEDAAGLALVSVGVGWSGQTQQEARGRLRAGSTVVVERQAGHQGHTFSLRGSSRALNSLEEACEALWAPEPASPRDARPTGGPEERGAAAAAKGAARRAEPPADPVAPSPPVAPAEAPAASEDPSRVGDWRIEATSARASVTLTGGVGDSLGLSCSIASRGRPMWRIEVIEGGSPLPPLAEFTLRSGATEVAVDAIRLPTDGLFTAVYEARYDEARHLPIVREMVSRRGEVVMEAAGSLPARLDAAGAERVVPDFFDQCGRFVR